MGKIRRARTQDTDTTEPQGTQPVRTAPGGNAFRAQQLGLASNTQPQDGVRQPLEQSRVLEQMGLEAPAPAPAETRYQSAAASLLADAARLRALDRELWNWLKVYRSTLGVNQQLLREGSHGTSAGKLALLQASTEDLASTRRIVGMYASRVLPMADAAQSAAPEQQDAVVYNAPGARRATDAAEKLAMDALSRASLRDERIGDIGRARIARAEVAEDAAKLFAEACKGLARRMVVAWFKVHADWAQDIATTLFDAAWAGVEAYFQEGILQGNFDAEGAIKKAVVKGAESIAIVLVDRILEGGALDTEPARPRFADPDAGLDATEKLTISMLKKMLVQFVRTFFAETFGNDKGAQEAGKIALQKVTDPETLVKQLSWYGIDELFGVRIRGLVQ